MTNDPVTQEIIQNSLQAAADEMFAAFRKTAMSSIIYEVLDMGTGILDKNGHLACSGAGIPAFIGMLDKGVQVIAMKFGETDDIAPGDIFATNDPYYGGVTHLNDIILAMPVFYEGKLVAWTSNIAHNTDLGGLAPGSLSADAVEIFQEGLRIPAIRIIEKGEPIVPVMEMIRVNSRMPDVLEGDIWAAIASVRIGTQRVLGLIEKYGIGVFEHALTQFMDYGEERSRAALMKLPHGTFEWSEEQDDGETFNVKITIDDDRYVVDLRDNPPQRLSPVNISRDGVIVSTQMIFKSLTDAGAPTNEGAFRPIEVLTTPGTVFHAVEPAAVGFYYEIALTVYDLMWRCLAPHMPDIFPAGHFASIFGTYVSGKHPDHGRHYTIVEPQLGGWGATRERDGVSAMFSGFHGETYNCPAEVNEARNGLVIDQMAINDELGGEGKYRGGRGIILDYRMRDDATVTASSPRSKFPPWALASGREGSPNYIEIIRATGEREVTSMISGLKLKKDDVLRIHTANGGGFGKPKDRDRDAVRDDVLNGLISRENAEAIYGPF